MTYVRHACLYNNIIHARLYVQVCTITYVCEYRLVRARMCNVIVYRFD